MDTDTFDKFVASVRGEQDRVLRSKGPDYTLANFKSVDDRLSNFKDVASFLGIHPEQVWAVYWLKHVFAICTYIKTGRVASESIESRFIDEMNYSLLGMALIEEQGVERGLGQVNQNQAQAAPDTPSGIRTKQSTANRPTDDAMSYAERAAGWANERSRG